MSGFRHHQLRVTQLVHMTGPRGVSHGHVTTKKVRSHFVVHAQWGKPPWTPEGYRHHHKEFATLAEALDYHDMYALTLALALGITQIKTWNCP